MEAIRQACAVCHGSQSMGGLCQPGPGSRRITAAGGTWTPPRPARRLRTAQSARGILTPTRACECAGCAVVATHRTRPAGCGAHAARRACCTATPRLVR
eukprot:11994090-Alexandrium_andersonii.AAC.1